MSNIPDAYGLRYKESSKNYSNIWKSSIVKVCMCKRDKTDQNLNMKKNSFMRKEIVLS